MQWQYYLWAFAGGGMGSLFRLWISRLDCLQGKYYFLATLTANLIACFVLGLIAHRYSVTANRDWTWYLLAAGFCGGLSTFSTFSLENLQLISTGQWGTASFYIIISIVGCLLAVWAGMTIPSRFL